MTTSGGSPAFDISPSPSEEEAAAIVAAIQLGLPSSVTEPPRPAVSRWRFSGRWWSRPVPARRTRPGS